MGSEGDKLIPLAEALNVLFERLKGLETGEYQTEGWQVRVAEPSKKERLIKAESQEAIFLIHFFNHTVTLACEGNGGHSCHLVFRGQIDPKTRIRPWILDRLFEMGESFQQ